MRYTHIAFDIDGTLIDTQDTFTYSFAKTILEIKGDVVDPSDLVRYFGLPSMVGIEQVGFPDHDYALELWEKHYREMAATKSRPYPGVHDAIEKIVASGIKIGVITSRSRDEFEYDRNLNPWRPWLTTVICADDTVKHKPDGEPAIAFAAAAGVDVSRCLYMGDTIMDALCAANAGMDFALAHWGSEPDAGIPATYRFSSAEEMLRIVL
ncbi:MAG: HAD family hydrolase [Bacteroidales bacterium]|nr:HAD family hydrolase [Bacteroidales bacterium]